MEALVFEGQELEGEPLNEEDILEMMESLMQTDDTFHQAQSTTVTTPQLAIDDIASLLEYVDDNIEVEDKNSVIGDQNLVELDKWWDDLDNSVSYDAPAYDWSFEDFMIMLELVSCPYTNCDFPWEILMHD